MNGPGDADFATRVRERVVSWGMLAAVGLTLALSLASTFWKMTCSGPTYTANGASVLDLSKYGSLLCYSDQRALWGARDLVLHALPYSGSYTADGQLTGGTIEYPVLSGVFMWLVALPAQTDRGFVLAAGVVLSIASVAVAFLLYALAGRRGFLWAAAPALALYVAYNVDVLPVFASVAGIAVMLWPSRLSPTARAYIAAVAFGIGGGLKLYPLMFALPLAIWLAWGHTADARRFRWGSFAGILATAAGVLVLANLPFAVWNTEGWLASFQFQSARALDDNTMAIWWWLPHLLGFDLTHQTQILTAIAAAATSLGLAAAVAVGLRIARRTGEFPWLEVSGAMLAAYMLLNKVNSPQYILWLLPFFVLVRVPVRWVLAYFIADLAVFFGYFRRFAIDTTSGSLAGVDALLAMGIIFRACLLAYFFVSFLACARKKTVMIDESGSTVRAHQP